jgi:LysR family transcriptional regulator of gallate degradation
MPSIPKITAPSGAEMPSLAHLLTFVHVARTGSVTHSAETLFRAQSAITRAVRQLESQIGHSLFERRPSGMLLTPVGICVLARAERVFSELETLADWCASQSMRSRARSALSLPSYLLHTRRLQLLVALAGTHHMPTAARATGITQPAVSSAIKVLEAGAGVRLFQRSGKGIFLTVPGETFVLLVRRTLNELRHVPDDIAALQGTLRGQVMVGALPLGRTLILPEAIARVSAAFPGIRICTDESPYETLVAGLRAGDIDFILGALRPDQEAAGLVNEALMSEQMVVLARNGHPLSKRRSLTLAALHTSRWILPRSHAPARAMLDKLFRRERLTTPEPTLETADLAVVRGTLLRSDMIAAVSAQQLHVEIASGALTVLKVDMPGTQRPIGLMRRAGGGSSPAAQAMMDIVRDVVSENLESVRITR